MNSALAESSASNPADRRTRRGLAQGLIASTSTMLLLLMAGIVLCGGCRSSGTPKQDSEIRRNAEAARTAYAEGFDEEAVLSYRQAIKRAWTLDDAEAIAENSYSLAAALGGMGRWPESRDWLFEARASAVRAGMDTTHIGLMEAEVARRLGDPWFAARKTEAVAHAMHLPAHDGSSSKRCAHGKHAATCQHCVLDGDDCGCELEEQRDRFGPSTGRLKKCLDRVCPDTACRERRLDARATRVEVHLMRANLAMDMNRIATAQDEITAARRKLLLLKEDKSIHAAAQRAEGRLLMLQNMPIEAADRFDLEAELLFEAQHYREIPWALLSSGESYESVGMFLQAAARYHRVARILYGRDDYLGALLFIERSTALAEMTGDLAIQGQLAVLFKEVALAVDSKPDRTRKRDKKANREVTPEELIAPPVEDDPLFPETDAAGRLPDETIPWQELPAEESPPLDLLPGESGFAPDPEEDGLLPDTDQGVLPEPGYPLLRESGPILREGRLPQRFQSGTLPTSSLPTNSLPTNSSRTNSLSPNSMPRNSLPQNSSRRQYGTRPLPYGDTRLIAQ
jgi:hypothetical protein